ncbi:MAG: polyphosphate kinase [Saprospiraceae bacterium]|nr:polyphosphate kinase [Saprospiraceae bacterium]
MGKIKLKDISTKAPTNLKKKDTKEDVKKLARKIGELQHKLYAEKKHSLLIIIQGMDASGKDGATKNVFASCNPSGIDAYSFKKPTELEFAHDFLWRCHKLAPAKGNIMIFVRSHYEDILIQRVHNWIDMERVEKRMNAINAFEELIAFDNNTTVLKFYMHISPERQLEKLQERIDEPEKQWKHNPGDWEERKLWDQYMEAYEYAINESTTPWHIVPCDSRWYRNYFMANIVLETLEKLNPQLPHLEAKED